MTVNRNANNAGQRDRERASRREQCAAEQRAAAAQERDADNGSPRRHAQRAQRHRRGDARRRHEKGGATERRRAGEQRGQREHDQQPDQHERRGDARVVRPLEAAVEARQLGERVARRLRADRRPLASLERAGRRRDVRDRDQPGQPRRGVGQHAAVAGPDDRDRVAAHVVVLPGRRQRDVERDLPGPPRELDQRLAAWDAAADDRVPHLATQQRGERAAPADGRALAHDEQPVRGPRRAEDGRRGGRDDHRNALRGRGLRRGDRGGRARPPGLQSTGNFSPSRGPILDETQGLRSRRRADAADAADRLVARAALRRLRGRAVLRPERRPRADGRDRRRARLRPVLHLRQARPEGLRREDRRARRGARAARR